MSASVLATGRAFSSQSAREISSRAGCPAGSPRARTHPTEIAARIQPDLRIQIVHALSQLDSCTRGWMGGRACDGMESLVISVGVVVVEYGKWTTLYITLQSGEPAATASTILAK